MNAARSNTATATTATADVSTTGRYVGRFAPSPSGALHLGSLYTAAASYLDARARGGLWLVRMEDVDTPRVVPGSASGILQTLQSFGFEWDGEVIRQSDRMDRYEAALDLLRSRGETFECSCSRTQLADEERYPGYCREAPMTAGVPTATRLRVEPGSIQFKDRIQGSFRQDVAASVGDLVLRRRDQLFAYVLTVVVDDQAQGITHVVRGADLLDNTPRQIYLQRRLEMEPPSYSHLPVLTEPGGKKLAKSARSVDLSVKEAHLQLIDVFGLLGLSPTPALRDLSIAEVWAWAVARWNMERVPKRLSHALPA